MKLFKQIFTCLISSLALLSGCTKEPTMFEKCFVAEQEKLEELPDQILYARYGYSPELHRIFNKMSAQYRALDVSLLARLEEKRRVEWARVTELQSQNPLYQKYKALYDDHRKHECCGDDWASTFEAYREAEKACEDDSACHISVSYYPDVAALTQANPENQLLDAFRDDVNTLMKGRDWTLILGAGHESEKYYGDNFLYALPVPAGLYPDGEIALTEMSPSESVRTSLDIYLTFLDHWLGEFDAKRQSVFGQFGGIARETCNTRGLYE